MKFITSAFSTLILVAGVLGQSAYIETPTKGNSVTAGTSLVIDVVRPNTISSSVEIGIAIGIASCAASRCYSAAETLGTLLYNGIFNPQYDAKPFETGQYQPHQEITVQIPEDFTKGDAQINFAHFFLLGASLSPTVETSSVSVEVK
ncbi:hypothetical protein D9758_009035 [Tetrapyrgos nigripes]|uniref:Uncharacterized protein n=1 Tax=Tetrapyrgos nigripes TaxID=182062 RepID=A0A8H5GAD4_9AGAR|nr:hypothetical protein D9758_009035 [Tetrapyrgos nigripes]